MPTAATSDSDWRLAGGPIAARPWKPTATLALTGVASWHASGTPALVAAFLSAMLLAMPSGAVAADRNVATGIYTDLSAEAWSNGLPILDIEGRWQRGYKARGDTQRAYETARAEAGVWLRLPSVAGALPIRLGALVRADASTVMSGEAAEILAAYQGKRDPEVPGDYDARLRAQLWKGTGWTWQLPACLRLADQVCFTLGWDHMQLQRLRVMAIDGVASYLADGSYRYQVQVRDDSWKTRAPFLAAPEGQGTGDALSFAWHWRAVATSTTDTLIPVAASVQVRDAWSSLRWKGIQTNRAVINSDTRQRNAQGYIDVQPLIRGQYTSAALHERIPTTVRTDMAWQAAQGQWTLAVQHRQGLWQRWLGWQGAGPGWSDWQPRVALEPVVGVLQLGMAWRGMELAGWTDRGDAAARARGFVLRGQWGW